MNGPKARLALDWLLRLTAAAGAMLLVSLIADPATASVGAAMARL